MTTLRLTPEQKDAVRQAAAILEKSLGRTLSLGETVAALADAFSPDVPDLAKDPFYDTTLVFDAGRTDAGSHDRLIYGRGR